MTDFERISFKITWIKAGALILSACIFSFTVGAKLEGWNAFRKDTNETLMDYKAFKKKAEPILNRFTADKNRNVIVKNP